MISVLVPIGDFPFFAHACHKNICENGNGEVIFLTTNNPSDRLLRAFDKINCRYQICPIKNTGHGVHLQLLDWAIRNLSISEWVMVQHCDTFWKTKWNPQNLDGIACVFPYYKEDNEFAYKKHKFLFNGQKLLRTHDFAGFYHVPSLIKYNLKFKWGALKNIGSKELLKKINSFYWIHRNRLMDADDFIDGSDNISLEIAIKFPDKIKELKGNYKFLHCWAMFAAASELTRQNDVIHINLPFKKCQQSLPSYAWVSSYLFDKDEMKDKILPWSVVNRILPTAKISNLCELLNTYRITNNILGNDLSKVKRVEFSDKSFDIKNKLYL